MRKKNYALIQKNFIAAFELAEHYKSLFLQNHSITMNGRQRRKVHKINTNATDWLAQGLEFIKKTNSNLDSYINLDNFFNSLTHIKVRILYVNTNPKNNNFLLNSLTKNKTIKTVIIEKQSDLNDFLFKLLTATKTISTLTINVKEKLSDYFVLKLTEILKMNTSMRVIEFNQDSEITTENFKVLLNSLAINPKSKINTLIGQGIAIDNDDKADLLIHHLQNHKQLEYVQPWQGLVISENKFNTIDTLLSKNTEEKKYLIERAAVKGSARGFFAAKGYTSDLGNNLAPYLSKEDAFSLMQVAKLPAQSTKAMCEEMIEQVSLKL